MDGIDRFTCDCYGGWKGVLCDRRDECYSDPCQNNATCVDGVDEYRCVCVPGYEGVNCENGKVLPRKFKVDAL